VVVVVVVVVVAQTPSEFTTSAPGQEHSPV
jgi:hypothetical protein